MASSCESAGKYTRAEGLTSAEYAAHSNQAHAVFAFSILLSLLFYGIFFIGTQGWGGFLRYRPQAVPLAFIGSGAATLAAGCYLALRVRFICNGSSSCDGAAFVEEDLVQQQHLAVSALLASCGALELAHGLTEFSCPAAATGHLLARRGRAGPLGPLVHEWWCAAATPLLLRVAYCAGHVRMCDWLSARGCGCCPGLPISP